MSEERKSIEVVAAVIIEQQRVFATQRGYGEWQGWWEFPGGKLETGESPEVALRREIQEELATHVEIGERLCTVAHDYPNFHLTMHCYLCRVVAGTLSLLEHNASRWLSRSELEEVQWLPADVEVVELLKEML
jgi:hydrolase, NUDIX family